ncbi:DNA helicase [Microbacterium sp. Marseille-Q6965]|uniref:DNA helicase n=1 Tax=Microbacterium sp. Marseille-Q6965 TaxID=2965072 RepID=UPI0021B7CE8C|nr:DNA helicase [Microbacterium sp. Marseille-Q6965]
MSPSRKQKKELRKLQKTAAELWQDQQVLAQRAADVAREAGRQASVFGRQKVMPAAQAKYHEVVDPYVDKARPYVAQGVLTTKRVVDSKVVPVVGTVVGKAMGAWDAASEARLKLTGKPVVVPPKKKSAGPIVALVLGAAAAVGILVAAWQTLRADDELWVADDPLAAPDA